MKLVSKPGALGGVRTALSVCVALCALGGCGLAKDDADGGDLFPDISREDFEAFEDEVTAALRRLFPELSEEELLEIRAAVSFEDVIAITDELEAIRDEVAEFSADLFKSAGERVRERQADLADMNDGYPTEPEAVGRICLYDEAAQHGRIQLSGVLDGSASVLLDESSIALSVDGQAQDFTLSCLPNGPPVDIVFLIDITGSMSNVIHSVRDSVVDFIDILESSGLRGTVGVVTFQDTVGVNRSFQQTAPRNNYERSPFFAPVALDDAAAIADLRSFVNRLEANRGADAPENLAAAIDFARNNVIGVTGTGEPNVIGDGRFDPEGTEAFPRLQSERQVFVVLTDVTFHGDDRNERNSSLEPAFLPRDASVILQTLHDTGTVVHVSDPSWSDAALTPTSASVDADYWAIHTGGVGEDRVAGYSLVDLELVVVAEDTGLLDITLDKILSSSCTLDFDAELTADSQVSIAITVQDVAYSTALSVELY